MDKSQHEKKINHHESSDSGIDLSLSTNSSLQYPQQQHLIIHRPLSALNEDVNTSDGNHEQSIRIPVIHPGRNRSIENTVSNNIHEQQQHPPSSFFDEREKINHSGAHLDTLKEFHQQTNLNKNEFLRPPTQQHRSLNDLTNRPLLTTHTVTRKLNISPLRKKTKLNIIVEQSIPLSSSPRLAVNDDQIHSGTRTTSSSSNQTTSHSIQTINKKNKPKAITPLGHYPNQEQIRAHINRSVIERQYPSYIPVPPRRGVIQQIAPLDTAPSKVNNLLFKQQRQSTTIFHPSKNCYF